MKRKRGGKSRSRSEKAQKRFAHRNETSHSRKSHSGGKSRAHTLTGRVQKNPRGFAFIIATDRGFEDVYVGAREAAKLMSDDIVEFTIEHRGRKPEARIHKILKHGQAELLGQVRETRQGMVLATETGETHPLEGAERRDVGQWVITTIEEYPTDRKPGVVSIKDTLGPELTPRHDITIAISRYGLEESFSSEALRVAEHARTRALEEMRYPGSRRDQRDLPYVTIDGEDAKDFDDAILVETPRQGPAFILYVAIADVSFFVERGSALDREARKRGTSVYFPGYCLPMLPETLSNDLCSLRPQQDRLAFVAEMHFDRDGNMGHTEFYPSLIKTAKRLTYTSVQGYLDERNPYFEDLKPVGPELDRAYELYRKLLRKRAERGVLDFDLPECKIEVDRDGRPVRLHHADRFEANKLIEEFMIAANQAVARELRETETLTLYRVHEPPEPDALDTLNTMLKNMGVPVTVKELSPRSFSRVLEQTKHLPIAPTLHQQILRLQKQAHYEPEPKGHFGLALRDYAHFTSPIRRYPDLVAHRSLRGLLQRKESRLSVDEFVSLGESNSQSERRAMEAERFVVRRKQCWFMQKHLGQTFPGRITGVAEKGIFVEIGDFATDGFVPLEFLPGHYTLDERHMCLRRQPGNQLLKVGDKIEVEVVKVSIDDGQITLGATEAESSLPAQARERRPAHRTEYDDRRESDREPQRDFDRETRHPRHRNQHRDDRRPRERRPPPSNGNGHGKGRGRRQRGESEPAREVDWRRDETGEETPQISGLERIRQALREPSRDEAPVATGEYVRPRDHAPRKHREEEERPSRGRHRESRGSRGGGGRGRGGGHRRR